jgi:hypothetical protein
MRYYLNDERAGAFAMSIYGTSDSGRGPAWFRVVRARTPLHMQVAVGVVLFILAYVVLFVVAYSLLSAVLILVVLGGWHLAVFGAGLVPILALHRRMAAHARLLLSAAGIALLVVAAFLVAWTRVVGQPTSWVGRWGWPMVALALGCISLYLGNRWGSFRSGKASHS